MDDWNDPKIHPQAMRLYMKKIPAKEAAKVFENRVKSHVNPNELRQKISDDVEKQDFRKWNGQKQERIRPVILIKS